MIVCFDAEDKISAGCGHLLAHRLFGVEVITKINRAKRSVASGIFLEPPIAGLGFTVLFFVAVLRRHELWTQRQCVAVANANHRCTQHRVEVFGFATVSKPVAALRTMDVVGVVKFRPVQCDQASAIEHFEGFKCLIFHHFIKRNIKTSIDILAIDSIQLHANVGVGWQFGNAEKRAACVFAMSLLQDSLMLEKRWRLNEKCRKRSHCNVIEGILCVVAVAWVCDVLEALSQFSNQMIRHRFHGGVS